MERGWVMYLIIKIHNEINSKWMTSLKQHSYSKKCWKVHISQEATGGSIWGGWENAFENNPVQLTSSWVMTQFLQAIILNLSSLNYIKQLHNTIHDFLNNFKNGYHNGPFVITYINTRLQRTSDWFRTFVINLLCIWINQFGLDLYALITKKQHHLQDKNICIEWNILTNL